MGKTGILMVAAALTLACSGQALAAADGADVYQRKCVYCHQQTGVGIPGAFPPLAGEAPKLLNARRAFPIQVLLFGLKGEIEVAGKTYDSTMPGFSDVLSDDEIAAVLNYVLSNWGNDKMLPKGHREIAAAEVQAERGKKLTHEEVREEWKKLNLK
ncbi:MAG: cytochrome c [Deltaproteobacteria bacterium]|nr:cytochrome c [Deltaproteobacteria bacterium]